MSSNPLFLALVEAGRGGGLRPNTNEYFLGLKDKDGKPIPLPIDSNYTLYTPVTHPLPFDLPVKEWTTNHLRLYLGIEMFYGNFATMERILPILEPLEADNPEQQQQTAELREYLKLEKELQHLQEKGLEDAFFAGVSAGNSGDAISNAFAEIGKLNQRLDELRPKLQEAGLLPR